MEKLSQVYEDKAKKNSFSQIERLMSIIRAKNKSIFIEKNFEAKNCACSEENNLKEKEVNIRGGETEEREETGKVKMLEK